MRLIDADILFREVEESKTSNPHKQIIIAQNHYNEHIHFLRMICDSETFDLKKHDEKIRADERRKFADEVMNKLSKAQTDCSKDNDYRCAYGFIRAIGIINQHLLEIEKRGDTD